MAKFIEPLVDRIRLKYCSSDGGAHYRSRRKEIEARISKLGVSRTFVTLRVFSKDKHSQPSTRTITNSTTLRPKIRTLHHLLQTRPHHVDVLDAEEAELCVLVERLILVSLACCPVSHRINPRPCVHDVHVPRIWIRLPHRLQHLFIL